MKNRKTGVAAVAVGAVGVMVLGACAAQGNQASVNRVAAPDSSTGNVLKASAQGDFKDVIVTQRGTSSCSIQDKGDKLEINCKNVAANSANDQAFVQVPTHKYKIQVVKSRSGSSDSGLRSIRRNGLSEERGRSKKNDITWSAPQSSLAQWGVGVAGIDGSIDVLITVTKI